jgi:hypothetical protein
MPDGSRDTRVPGISALLFLVVPSNRQFSQHVTDSRCTRPALDYLGCILLEFAVQSTPDTPHPRPLEARIAQHDIPNPHSPLFPRKNHQKL